MTEWTYRSPKLPAGSHCLGSREQDGALLRALHRPGETALSTFRPNTTWATVHTKSWAYKGAVEAKGRELRWQNIRGVLKNMRVTECCATEETTEEDKNKWVSFWKTQFLSPSKLLERWGGDKGDKSNLEPGGNPYGPATRFKKRNDETGRLCWPLYANCAHLLSVPSPPGAGPPGLAYTFRSDGGFNPNCACSTGIRLCSPRGFHGPAPKGMVLTSQNLDPPLPQWQQHLPTALRGGSK